VHTRTRLTFTVSIPDSTQSYRALLPHLGTIERIILRATDTPARMVALVLNSTSYPIDVSWEALRLLKLHTPWGLEQHARLLYESGDLLDLVLDTRSLSLIQIEFRDAIGMQEITVEYTTKTDF